MPRAVLRSLGAELELLQFDGTRWFHGTRSLAPERFLRNGLLPLPGVIDWLWDQLFTLADGEVTAADWQDFRRRMETGVLGHDSRLYQHKMNHPGDHGPLGVLVRDVLLSPSATGSHDYLAAPEIVQDIARAAVVTLGLDIEARFASAARPCIVTFRTEPPPGPGAVETAIIYAHSLVVDDEPGHGSNYSYSAHGTPIPPEDILDVEVEPQRALLTRGRPVRPDGHDMRS